MLLPTCEDLWIEKDFIKMRVRKIWASVSKSSFRYQLQSFVQCCDKVIHSY